MALSFAGGGRQAVLSVSMWEVGMEDIWNTNRPPLNTQLQGQGTYSFSTEAEICIFSAVFCIHTLLLWIFFFLACKR